MLLGVLFGLLFIGVLASVWMGFGFYLDMNYCYTKITITNALKRLILAF